MLELLILSGLLIIDIAVNIGDKLIKLSLRNFNSVTSIISKDLTRLIAILQNRLRSVWFVMVCCCTIFVQGRMEKDLKHSFRNAVI